MATLGVGLIGSGFMGKAHALGFLNANRAFDLPVRAELAVLADATGEVAARAAAALGFPRSTGDWRALVADPAVGIVSITTPNTLHRAMALAAIAGGKHVYCEKPLAPTAAEAGELTLAAERAGVSTQVGFNYLKNPMVGLARELVRAGEIGAVRSFRGVHAEDFMSDAASPWTWRLDPPGGGGALADIGSHILALARFVVGPIAEVRGECATLVTRRPFEGGTRAVEVDDVATASLRFAEGAVGTIEANWMATGRKMGLEFEVSGSEGAIRFTQERMNELRIYRAKDPAGLQGFRTIEAGPAHPPYGAFCPAPGHGLGFNDLKTIEVADFLRAVAGERPGHADFREGWEVAKAVEAVYRSAREGTWIKI